MKKKIFLLLFISLISCAGVDKNRKYTNEIRVKISENNYNSALEIAKNKKFYSEKINILIKNLELGTIHYLKQNYYQSLRFFEIAKKISDELYTISISKKVLSGYDANLDNYYGEYYELSMIRFYLSLVNYNLYKQGYYEEYIDENNKKIEKKELTETEKNFHLTYARSSIVEWDTFMKTLQKEKQGVDTYKNDMLLKIWGSFIHYEYGSLTDKQIAIQLYKDAKDVLLKNYNMYSVFNKKDKKFNDDYKKLENKTLQQLYKDYIEETQYSNEIKEFIERNKKNTEKDKFDNLVIILKDANISEKIAVPIQVPTPKYGDIKIEIPSFIEKEISHSFTAKLFKNNEEYASTKLTLIEPLSNIAKKTFEDKKASIIASTTARVLAKYAIAVAPLAVKTENSSAQFAASVASALMFLEIERSSKADIRYWSTLFSELYMGGMRVGEGKYKLKVYLNDKKIIYENDIIINNNQTNFIDINNFNKN